LHLVLKDNFVFIVTHFVGLWLREEAPKQSKSEFMEAQGVLRNHLSIPTNQFIGEILSFDPNKGPCNFAPRSAVCASERRYTFDLDRKHPRSEGITFKPKATSLGPKKI